MRREICRGCSTGANLVRPPNFQGSAHDCYFLLVNVVGQSAFELNVVEVMTSNHGYDFEFHCCHWHYSNLSLRVCQTRENRRRIGTVRLVLGLDCSEKGYRHH